MMMSASTQALSWAKAKPTPKPRLSRLLAWMCGTPKSVRRTRASRMPSSSKAVSFLWGEPLVNAVMAISSGTNNGRNGQRECDMAIPSLESNGSAINSDCALTGDFPGSNGPAPAANLAHFRCAVGYFLFLIMLLTGRNNFSPRSDAIVQPITKTTTCQVTTMKTPLRLPLTAVMAAAVLSGCYDPTGPIPEDRKPGVAPQWTDAEVAAVVQQTYESIPATFVIDDPQLPAGCNDVRFIRFKTRDSSADAAQADAALLLVPGVLEGANGFEYIGRQLVYMAKTQRGRNIEVWSMDRRSNCLEDLRGMQAAEAAPSVQEAEDLIVGYYYGDLSIDGAQFAGFRKSSDMPYLLNFGMQQTTEDMYAIIRP